MAMAKPPENPEVDEMLHRLREQLILAQVRIMELEDTRDELTPRLAETMALLKRAQTLADQKVDALAHLEKVHADLEAQFQHMRHMQHVTNEALNETRGKLEEANAHFAETTARLDETAARLSAAEKHAEQVEHDLATLRVEAGELAAIIQRLEERGRQLDRELAEVSTTATVRLQRIEQLDAEMRALKATRSWRWSQPIRAIERWLARRRSS
jgi:chromosome segregation ATPase